MRVLVVDDNEVSRRVAVAMLEKLGQAPQVVESGQEAVRASAARAFDVVLMDVSMPGLDGYETARRIRAAEGGASHVWIIAATAYALEGDREACIAAGMDDYVAKPMQIDLLAAALERGVAAREN